MAGTTHLGSMAPADGVALVTGASRRIGRAIAQRLAREGYRLALHSSLRSAPEARLLAQELVAQGAAAEVFCADLEKPEEVARLLPAINATLGSCCVLVNNASLFEKDEAAPFDQSLFDRHMAINLRAPLQLASDFAAQLPADGGGVIVNLLDQRVLRLNPQFFTYTLSKSALWTATQTLAQSLAPRIRVNGVGPGPTLASHMQQPEDFAREADNILLRRAVDPAEIAEAVVFLIRAPGVTGQMLAVDGGQHLGWRTPDVAV